MGRTAFYSSSLFFRLFIGPVPVYYDFIQSLTLKSPLDTQSRSSVKIRTFTPGNLVLWSQAQTERGRRFRRLRRPRSLIQGRPARLLRGRRESGAEGWVPFVLPRLCSTEKTSHDVSRWKHLCPLLLGRKVRMRPVMDMNS